MAPIRMALIGLSSSAVTSWAADAHLPYLLSPQGKKYYKIVGLLNSSETASKRAIKEYNLPEDTKAYVSPEALASDEDVDLVVCATRVDLHYQTIKPSVEAGKNVFVEWPLAENAQRASELLAASVSGGGRTTVNLQSRVAPIVLKLKELLRTGTIGKVLSSEISFRSAYSDRYSISEGLAYFMDKKVGGNPITILVGHAIDFAHSVLGEYHVHDSNTQIQRPNQTVIGNDKKAIRQVVSDVPDLINVHGELTGSSYVVDGASLVLNYRYDPAFPGTPTFAWGIHGEKGVLRVEGDRGPLLSGSHKDQATLQLLHYSIGEVEVIETAWEDWQAELPARSRITGKVYEELASGKEKDFGIADFASAVQRHTEIDSFLYH